MNHMQLSSLLDPGRLRLEQQVGQLLMVGFPGTDLGTEIRTLIEGCHIGGACLFLGNCSGGPQQVRTLTADMQALAAACGLPPLLIALDQEGGIVTRLRHPFTVFPGQMALAATGRPDYTYQVARATAREMRSVGGNWNFAPVLDVNNNINNPVIGVRSFGEKPDEVARLGVTALRGYHDGGVLACGKHFPGHGDTHIDSHLGLPTVASDWQRLASVELPPFQAVIAAGIEALMTAHIRFLAIDDLPATLSARVLEGVLRQRLGFQGLIVTDALNMKAIADTYGPAEAAVRAIQAGSDLCLGLHTVDEVRAAFQALLAAVRNDTIPAARFQDAVRRVLEFKARLLALPAPTAYDFPVAEHQALARDVAAASVTLLRDRGILPIRPDKNGRVGLIDFTLIRYSLVEEARKPADYFRERLAARLPHFRGMTANSVPTPEEAAAARALAGESDTLILVTRNAALIAEQAALIRELIALGKPTVVYAARNPVDWAVCSTAPAGLTTYGDPPCALDAAVAVILGEAIAPGSLPITLPEPV